MNGGKAEQRDATLTDVYNALKELLKWAKFAGIKEVKPVLESKLDTDTKKIIYVLSDGNRGTREISKIVGTLSHASIANYWQDWEKSGLGESSQTMGGGSRFKHSFDLDDFGIKIPEIPRSVGNVEQPQTIVESQTTDHQKAEGESNVG